MKGRVLQVERTAMWGDLDIGEILTCTGWLHYKSKEKRRTEKPANAGLVSSAVKHFCLVLCTMGTH